MRLLLPLAALALAAGAVGQGAPSLPFEDASEECTTAVLGPQPRATLDAAGLGACSVAHAGAWSAACEGASCAIVARASAVADAGALPGILAVDVALQSAGLPEVGVCSAASVGTTVACEGEAAIVVDLAVGACASAYASSWLEEDQLLATGDWRNAVAAAHAVSGARVCRLADGVALSAP